MKLRTLFITILVFIAVCSASYAEVRIYRQTKDVAIMENGKVRQSQDQDDLFEFTYQVDREKNTITRIKMRRLDDPVGREDNTQYTILKEGQLWGSQAGNGGKVLVGVQKNGPEVIELGYRFAFVMRPSPFSQVMTGVYKRVRTQGCEKRSSKHK
jgi:hypothetical protein